MSSEKRKDSTNAQVRNCCSMVWAHRQSQWKDKNYCLSFSEEAENTFCFVLQCNVGCDFISWHTIIIVNYSSTSMSCCSEDQGKFASVLRSLKSGIWEYFSQRMNFCLNVMLLNFCTHQLSTKVIFYQREFGKKLCRWMLQSYST